LRTEEELYMMFIKVIVHENLSLGVGKSERYLTVSAWMHDVLLDE
jgi:hypothetical protein